jgi:FtsH-binding integral membrane protein
MCFSAEASFGAAVALLPAGAYCVDAAWRKDRRYLPFAVVPIVFGMQQICEALVWLGIERTNAEMTRIAALAYMGFALAIWPIWVPLALALLEERPRNRWMLVILAGVGLVFGLVFFLPLARDGGRGLSPTVVGHSIRYDLSVVPAIHSFWWWAWLAGYLIAVSGPLFASQNHRLRPLGAAVVVSALISYGLFEYAFASVWCFFAALLSLYVVHILRRVSGHAAEILEPHLRPMPSNS